VIAWVFELLRGGGFGESDFKDGQEPFFADSEEPLLPWFPDINNFAFGHIDDLVKAFDFAPYDFCDPEGLVHEPLGSLDGNELLAFTKEESEGT